MQWEQNCTQVAGRRWLDIQGRVLWPSLHTLGENSHSQQGQMWWSLASRHSWTYEDGGCLGEEPDHTRPELDPLRTGSFPSHSHTTRIFSDIDMGVCKKIFEYDWFSLENCYRSHQEKFSHKDSRLEKPISAMEDARNHTVNIHWIMQR